MTYNDKAKLAMLRKASERLASAKADFHAGRYDSCVSSLYYTAFQTVTALLISRGDFMNKHTHVRAFVNSELANKGLIDRAHAKLYESSMGGDHHFFSEEL